MAASSPPATAAAAAATTTSSLTDGDMGPPSARKTAARPTRASSSASASSDSDDAPGSPRAAKPPFGRRSHLPPSSPAAGEPTAAELDALVARMREEARAESGIASNASSEQDGANGVKRRTYGRAGAGGLKRRPMVAAAPSAASPAQASAVGQPLFGSSSLTSLGPSDPISAGSSSSQQTTTVARTSDTERDDGPARRRPAVSDSTDDDDEGYTFAAARRRPRGSAAAVVPSSSSFTSSPVVAAAAASHRSFPPSATTTAAVTADPPFSSPVAATRPSAPSTAAPKTAAPHQHPTRPFRPLPGALTRPPPLGLGPADNDDDVRAARETSAEIGEFAPSEDNATTLGEAEAAERRRLELVRLTPPPRSPSSSSAASTPFGHARSPTVAPVRPSRETSAHPSAVRGKALVDSDDEDGVVAVPASEMAALFGGGDEGEDSEAWVGDVVKAVKEKRRSGAKGLSKKELEQMKLEQARMQRERKTAIDRPEQETRDMLTFLRRKREAAQARKSSINPVDTQRFFRDGSLATPPPLTWSGQARAERKTTPALAFGPSTTSDDISSDPIVSSNPGASARPPSGRLSAGGAELSGAVPPPSDDDDGADEFDDVDALFAKKKQADADRAAKEAAARVAHEKRERLRLVKERAAALAAAQPKHGRKAQQQAAATAATGESDSDDLEIEPAAAPPLKAAADKKVVAKAARNSIVHRNLAKYGVVHKGRPSAGGSASSTTSTHLSAGKSTLARLPPPTESQIYAAGTTFGHGSSSPVGPSAAPRKQGSKGHVARPVSRDDLVANLLAKAKAQTRKAIAEKDAKYGRTAQADERWKTRVEPDWDGMLEGAQKRKSDWILVAEDEDEDGADDDDEEDDDFDPDATDEDAPDGVDAEAAENDEDGEAALERLLYPAVAANDVLDPMEAEDEDVVAFNSPADLHHSDKENALPEGAPRPPPRSESQGDKDGSGRPSSGVLEEREDVRLLTGVDDEDEDESFPMQRAKRRRTVLFDEDDEDDENAPPARSATSSARRLSFGAPLSPSASPRPSATPASATTKLASTDSFGFGAASQGGDGDGFGAGGFSQFFEPTQAATVVTERTDESQANDDGDMDLDGEGGFSQFFGATQAPASPKVQHDTALKEGGGLGRLRALAQDTPLRPAMSQLPSLEVSASQQKAVAEALAREAARHDDNNEGDEQAQEEPPRTGKRMFINQDGFFTQTEPSTFIMEETPDRPTQAGSLTTPTTPSIHTAAVNASSSSSPAKPVRRLVRRQDRALVEDDDSDDDLVVEDSQPPAVAPRLAPIFQRPEKKERDPNKPRKPRATTDEMRALMEDQAVESDEDDGFGAFGKTKASDDEGEDDDEDQDKIVEGLVNDEQMTEDAQKRADEERARLARELAEADDEAQMKIAQDVTTGEFRKKKKDALSMEMDSDEEDQYGTSKRTREERRRKRKLDKLDEMERLEFDPETAPFAKMYADTYNNDDDEYGNLLSDDEDAVPNSEANDFAESLGIPKARQHRRRIVASPEPLSRYASTTSIRMYDDGSDEDEDLTESQVQIRRGGAHRPQANPIQQDDEAYSLGVSTGYSNSDNSQKNSQGRRQKLESFARDESQNMSISKGGSMSSVTGLKRKASSASFGSADGSGGSSSIRRKVSALVETSSMLNGLRKKWDK